MKIDLSKYQRQIALKSFGLDKQSKLYGSQVLIVGMGGLGVPVAQYLNAMGVGTLAIMDNDTIAVHNLHRQVLYSEGDKGLRKVDVACKKLKKQNSQTTIKSIPEFLTKENALDIIKGFDIVVDATDNFATRYLINDACVLLGIPFVYGALHSFEGQVSVFNYNNGPTYRCLFPNMPRPEEIPNCDQNGVLGVVPGIIGGFQALEATKVLTGMEGVLSGKLLLVNGLTLENRLIQFNLDPKNRNIEQLCDSYGLSTCSTDIHINADVFMERKGPKQIIDVRSPMEFREHHLDNALNIPLPELDNSLNKINFDEIVYLICRSGKRSEQALWRLMELSPNAHIYSIRGGMDQITALCY